MNVMNYIYVAAGGAIGAALRLLVRDLILPFAAVNGFFIATLSVNVLGSFIIGALFPIFQKTYGLDSGWWFFLTTGILGGFTTFSAFSLDFFILYERSGAALAAAYAAATLFASLLGVFAGVTLGRVIA